MEEYHEQTLTGLEKMNEVLNMGVEASQNLVQVFADSIVEKAREHNRTTISLQEIVLLLDALKKAIGELKQ